MTDPIRAAWLQYCEGDPGGFYDADGEELELIYLFWESAWLLVTRYVDKEPCADSDDLETLEGTFRDGLDAAWDFVGASRDGA